MRLPVSLKRGAVEGISRSSSVLLTVERIHPDHIGPVRSSGGLDVRNELSLSWVSRGCSQPLMGTQSVSIHVCSARVTEEANGTVFGFTDACTRVLTVRLEREEQHQTREGAVCPVLDICPDVARVFHLLSPVVPWILELGDVTTALISECIVRAVVDLRIFLTVEIIPEPIFDSFVVSHGRIYPVAETHEL